MKYEILKSGDFDKIRFYLFSQSYVASKIVKILRKKYGIEKDNKNWVDTLIRKHINLFKEVGSGYGPNKRRSIYEYSKRFYRTTYIDAERQATEEISILAKELRFNEELLRLLILYNHIPDKIDTEEVYLVTRLSPIRTPGIYIKVHEHTSGFDLKNAYKRARFFFDFEKHLRDRGINKKKELVSFRKRKQIADKDLYKSVLYIHIERELTKLEDEMSNSITSDYEGKLVSDAIERIAGDSMGDDDMLDELLPKRITQLRTFYYEVSSRYQLPTPKKLTAILRLIGN